jgi:hypothetical protein
VAAATDKLLSIKEASASFFYSSFATFIPPGKVPLPDIVKKSRPYFSLKGSTFFCSFTQLSLNVVVRLKTIFSSELSLSR